MVRQHGKYSVDAKLVAIQGDKVVLKKADGTVITLPVARLSDTDRQYLRTLTQKQTTAQVAKQPVDPIQSVKVSASSQWSETTYAAARAFDGLLNTRWNSATGDTRGAWLAVQWETPVRIRHAVVHQAFDRITGLELQTRNDTNESWTTVVVLDGEELTRQKKGRAGRTPDDGSVNPVYTVHLDATVQTRGFPHQNH